MTHKHSIDTSIFQIDEARCNGYNACSCIERIMTTLSYHKQISSQQPQTFIDFCDKYYSKQYLSDYIHLICVHKNDINKFEMENKTCSSINACLSTTRHYRDRAVNDNAISHLYLDIFDSLHFYIYHLKECGLRISINTDDIKDIDNDDNDYINCKDKIVAAIQKEIE
eukprot:447415_1